MTFHFRRPNSVCSKSLYRFPNQPKIAPDERISGKGTLIGSQKEIAKSEKRINKSIEMWFFGIP